MRCKYDSVGLHESDKKSDSLRFRNPGQNSSPRGMRDSSWASATVPYLKLEDNTHYLQSFLPLRQALQDSTTRGFQQPLQAPGLGEIKPGRRYTVIAPPDWWLLTSGFAHPRLDWQFKTSGGCAFTPASCTAGSSDYETWRFEVAKPLQGEIMVLTTSTVSNFTIALRWNANFDYIRMYNTIFNTLE